MNIKTLLITIVLSVFASLVIAGNRPINHLVVDNSITMVKSDYQTIVDYVNTNLSNTHDYPVNSDDYFGTSAYYSNFDAREGKYSASFASSDDAIREALSTVLLPNKFPNPSLNESFMVEYATYSNVNNTESMRFYCTSLSPLTFTAIVPTVTEITMDSLDYQFIVDYVNTNLSNTHEHPTTAEDHYGASAYYHNFDGRSGKYDALFASYSDAIKAAFNEVYLPNKYSDAIESDTFTISYDVYTGSNMTDSMTFLCTSETPMSFSLLGEEDDTPSGFDSLSFGTDTTFDVITWNIEHFPKNSTVTMTKIKDAIIAMDPEVIAFQEIDDTAKFREMVNELDDYEGIIGHYGYAPMCYIYKTASVQVNGTDQLFEDDWSAFPREPFVLDVTFSGEQFIIIGNHLKCCGDGVLDESDSGDEEYRRLNAINSLKDHIDTNWSDKNVIVLGDFNDVLEDAEANNVFTPFIDDAANYVFADMGISLGSSDDWSYPSWPSDLDHILITNELFDRTEAEVIKIDDHITWAVYDADISDHRPVGIRVVDTGVVTALDDIIFDDVTIKPNPVEDFISITGIPENMTIDISLYSQSGQLLAHQVSSGESLNSIDMTALVSGVYVLNLHSNSVKKSYKIVKN